MEPSKGRITLPHLSRPFRANRSPTEAQSHYVPLGFSGQGPGTLDLGKVQAYFSVARRGTYAGKTLGEIRNQFAHGVYWPPPKLESVVAALFTEYCRYLASVRYEYTANTSPFQVGFQGSAANCIGRAVGFLQLLTIVGLPAEKLFRYTLGGDPAFKICEKVPVRRSPVAASYHHLVGSTPGSAPNAVRVSSLGRAPQIARTTREPFDNHDATFIDIPGFSRKCWDPLMTMSYNAFSDCFSVYRDVTDDGRLFTAEPWATLQRRGLRCYISQDVGRGGDRIYYLPPRSKLVSTLRHPRVDGTLQRAVREQTPMMQAYTDLSAIEADPRLAIIFDQDDWNPLRETHPPALAAMFSRPLELR